MASLVHSLRRPASDAVRASELHAMGRIRALMGIEQLNGTFPMGLGQRLQELQADAAIRVLIGHRGGLMI